MAGVFERSGFERVALEQVTVTGWPATTSGATYQESSVRAVWLVRRMQDDRPASVTHTTAWGS